MRKDLESPEFAKDPLETNLEGIYRQVYARAGMKRSNFARVMTAFALGVGFLNSCDSIGVVPTSTSGPGEQTPTVTEVTQTPTPEVTGTPTNTETPENLRSTNSVNPEKLHTIMENFNLEMRNSIAKSLEDQAGYPLVFDSAAVIAYDLGASGGNHYLDLLLLVPEGIIKARIDYVDFSIGGWPQPHFAVDRLDNDTLATILNTLDRHISKLNEVGTDPIDFGYLIMRAVNNDGEAKACLTHMAGLTNIDELCSFDSSQDTLTSQQLLDEIGNYVVSGDRMSPESTLDITKYPTLDLEGNGSIVWQFPAE
jgi:hypothetical protein